MNSSLHDRLQEARDFILSRVPAPPNAALVFGSNLAGEFLKRLEILKSFPFEEIPHFHSATVEGHGGVLHYGRLHGLSLIVADGRLHYYEGYPMSEVVFPVRAYACLGVKALVLSNASGALNPLFKVGDIMAVTDHLNLTGRSPLRGPHDERLGPRFVDMGEAYDPALIKKLTQAARRVKLKLRKGVYVGIAGPAYETPAEIRMYRKLGGDAIGMSTVSEITAARHQGLRCAALSCITNVLGGKKTAPLSHAAVVEAAKKIQGNLAKLLEDFLRAEKEILCAKNSH